MTETTNAHHLYDENDYEVKRPVVFMHAFHGWVREMDDMPGQHYATQVIATGEFV